MNLVACLVCEKPFKLLTYRDLLASDRDDSIVTTKCGHLFHRTCLDCAFVFEKVQLQVENRPERRHCPYKPCQQDVTGFPLIQINPVQVGEQQNNGYDSKNLKSTIEKLTAKNEELKKQIRSFEKRENEDRIKKGDRAYWKEKDGKYILVYVQELQAKIKIESGGGNSSKTQMTTVDAIRSKFYNLPFIHDQNVPLTELLSEKAFLNYESLYKNKGDQRPDSIMSRDSGISTSERSSPVPENLSQWSPPPNSGVGQQPKWIAGDRVYFPKEKQHATVKWIGYSDIQFKFIVGIEYDEPVGDNSLDTMNIPVRYKLGHGKKLEFEELNRLGVKEESSRNVFGFGRFMFGSGSRKGPPSRSKSFQQNSNSEKEEKLNNGNSNGKAHPPKRSFSSPAEANSNSSGK